jgi:F420-dependent oxidoreductase-like protein
VALPVRFGLKHSGQDCTIEQLRAVWQTAEQAGFDHLWAFDHLAAIGQGGPQRPVFEGWSLLAAMAAATSRLRIGLMVTANTYRHPGLLAKIATTVDHLSGGRLEFGIGAGWNQLEHRMLGIEGLEQRVGRLSESLQVMRALWTQERASFSGRYYSLNDALHSPKPLQKPHPPIWIGAGGEQMLRLAARHADVWNPSGAAGSSVPKAVQMSAELDERCAQIGRDPATLKRSVQISWDGQDAGRCVQQVSRWVDSGFREVILLVSGPEAPARAESAGARLLPELRRLG